MRNIKIIYINLALVLLALGSWLILFPYTMPYTTDSAAYIEAARYFRQGQGLLVTNYGLNPIEKDLYPLDVFPPAYPFLIYAFTWLGIDETQGAIAVQAVSFALLPLLFFLLSRRILPQSLAIVSAVLCTWNFPIVTASLRVWSDLPFLVFTLLSFEVLFQAILKKRIFYIFLAGLLAGFACLVRNVGYALVFASLFGLIVAIISAQLPRNLWWKTGIAYMGGVVGIYGFWLLRNLAVFNSFQPYSMDPSELTLIDNIKHYSSTLTTMFLGTFIGTSYLTKFFIPLLGILLVLWSIYIILQAAKNRHWHLLKKEKIIFWLTLGIYGFSGSALVIIARTKYKWGEYINDRHLLQYQWIIIIGFIAALYFFYRKQNRRFFTGVIATVFILTFLVGQVRNISLRLSYDSAVPKQEFMLVESFVPLMKSIPQDALIASNYPTLIRIASKRPVRKFYGDMTPEALREKVMPYRDLYVILLPHELEKYPTWYEVYHARKRLNGYSLVAKKNTIILLKGLKPN